MMNRRKVYLFVFSGLFMFGAIALLAGFRQGWFSPSVYYTAVFETGEGIFVGTPVSIAGLRAGAVRKVELNADNKVEVEMSLQSKFAERIRKDSKAIIGRPFIIGERAISITPGSRSEVQLAEHAVIPGEESLEITDMLSGGRLSPYFNTFNKLMHQVQIVIEGDGSKNAVTLLDVYKQANRSLVSVEGLAKDVRLLRTDVFASTETKQIMKEMASASTELKTLMVEMQKAMPAMTHMSSQIVDVMPEISKTMKETVFTLQAMQRSFILSGGVKKLKDEQDAAERAPASTIEHAPFRPFAP